MTLELRKSIDELRQLSPQLNKATDEAGQIVSLVEKFLNEECSIGIPALVLIQNDKNGTKTYVGYERVGGRFRVAVIVDSYKIDEEGNRIRLPLHDWDDPDEQPEYEQERRITAWSDATRAEKLKTFKRLPDLLTALASSARESIGDVEETKTAVQQIKDAISPTQAMRPIGGPFGRNPLFREKPKGLEDDVDLSGLDLK